MRINPFRAIYNLPECKDPFKNPPDFALFCDIEMTNNCNFNCIFCHGRESKLKKGYMDFEIFKNIVGQLKENGCHGVRFNRWGEPTLHPQLISIIKYTKSMGLLAHLTTNGSLLNDNLIKGLLNSGLDSIIVSFQGMDKKGYTEMRGDNYDLVKKNVLRFIEMRGENSSPFLQINSSSTNETKEQKEAFIKEWTDAGCDETNVLYTTFDRIRNRAKIKNILPRCRELSKKFKCQEVQIKLSINWNGDVTPCCLDSNNRMILGNVKNDKLIDLWNCDTVKAIRKLTELKRQDLFILCSKCQLNADFRGLEKE